MSFHRRELSEQLGAAVGWAADRCDEATALSIDGLGISSTQLNAGPGPVTIPSENACSGTNSLLMCRDSNKFRQRIQCSRSE